MELQRTSKMKRNRTRGFEPPRAAYKIVTLGSGVRAYTVGQGVTFQISEAY